MDSVIDSRSSNRNAETITERVPQKAGHGPCMHAFCGAVASCGRRCERHCKCSTCTALRAISTAERKR